MMGGRRTKARALWHQAASCTKSDVAPVHSVTPGKHLRRWGRPGEPEEDQIPHEELNSSPFPVCWELNRKIVLWKGDITRLQVDGLVVTTNESLDDMSGLSGRARRRGGPGLIRCCRQSEGCRTGDAILTGAYNLPAQWLIHTVSPRWSQKYESAAESALHSCYKRCFELVEENQMESVGFCPINAKGKSYPEQAAVHVALRTIRRSLEHWGAKCHTVVLAIEDEHVFQIYFEALKLYFPRSQREMVLALHKLPPDNGNEFGDRVIEHRQIRIRESLSLRQDNPTTTPSLINKESKSAMSFAESRAGPDEKRKLKTRMTRKQQKSDRIEREYLLRASRVASENFDDLEKLGFLRFTGADVAGRNIVVISAYKVPASSVSPERLTDFVIRTLDRVVNSEYVLIYFHSRCRKQNRPELSWFRTLNRSLPRKYKKNLKALYIVHPSNFVKAISWVLRPLVKRKFRSKIRTFSRIAPLFDIFDEKQVLPPQGVLEYDQYINGSADLLSKSQLAVRGHS